MIFKTAIVVDKDGLCILLNDYEKLVVDVTEADEKIICEDYALKDGETFILDNISEAFDMLKPKINFSIKQWEETASTEEIEENKPPATELPEPPQDNSEIQSQAMDELIMMFFDLQSKVDELEAQQGK